VSDPFPAAGHKYLVDFRDDHGRGFKVQLEFHSEVSLTYVGVKPDGTLDTHPETVDITVLTQTGCTATLSQGFSYQRKCVAPTPVPGP